ncbi:MAG: beta-ketoacyl synthase chain length factor [Bacteroidia bacterium]|nr:beta-ketoacyl synthase chain length factor [Bacteroidia bacterium]
MAKEVSYINGLGCISPQPTLEGQLIFHEPSSVEGNRLKAIDPNYKEFIPPEMVRRMGRIIKMGVATAKTCLADAGESTPDMIITGTGLGCLQDTDKFLGTMIVNKEEFLTPTAFIQSTHNTISAQIALLTKCHGYNFTYVHRGFSMETAILDSLMQLQGGAANRVLMGCADELTNNSFEIQNRMGFWRKRSGKGAIAGEGAAFFLLENKKTPTTYAVLNDVAMLFNPTSSADIHTWIHAFLRENDLEVQDLDLVMLGKNGGSRFDYIYDEVLEKAMPGTPTCLFKHLCGEYMTATGFATWLTARILRDQKIPKAIQVKGSPAELKHLLIYNHYQGINHSLILLSQA